MRTGQDRRSFLMLSGAAVVAAALPPVALVTPVAAAAPKPPMLTWIVGTPGESDFEVIRAATREAAVRFRAEECEMDPADDDFVADGPCECCSCTANGGYEATRVEAWDAKPVVQITDADWVDAGFDGNCARCGDPANREDDGRNVNGKAICGGCMTLADWLICDPEYAAERWPEAFEATPTSPDPLAETTEGASHG